MFQNIDKGKHTSESDPNRSISSSSSSFVCVDCFTGGFAGHATPEVAGHDPITILLSFSTISFTSERPRRNWIYEFKYKTSENITVNLLLRIDSVL